MKKKSFIPMLLVFIGLTALSFSTATVVKLRLKPQQGKTYNVNSKANIMTMMEVQGQTINMSQSLETQQSFVAKEVSDEQSVVETQIESMKLSISQMGMKLEYDSEHPEKTSPMLAGQTKEMDQSIKKPVTVTYDALGKLVGDSIDLSKNQLGAVIIELPEQDLSVGSKWNCNKHQDVSGAEFNVNMEYTVTAISKKSVDLSFTGEVESSEVTGNYTGTASINPQTGLMMTSTTKMNISMTLNEQGLSLPVTMVGNTTVEVK